MTKELRKEHNCIKKGGSDYLPKEKPIPQTNSSAVLPAAVKRIMEVDKMTNPVFDLDSWEPMFPIGDDMAVDSKGHFKLRMGDGMAMDMDTGEVSFTTPWRSNSGHDFGETDS